MFRYVSLYSGSSGNSALVYTENTRILIDAGETCKKLTESLKTSGVTPSDLDAILITHEHTDHIKALDVFLKKCSAPVYATGETISYFRQKNNLPASQKYVEVGEEPFTIGDITVWAFVTHHDSISCRGFRMEHEGRVLAVATDLGEVDDNVYEYLSGSNTVAIESNYDLHMLVTGHYSPSLKDRIVSRHGHLSNDECAVTVERLAEGGTAKFMLVHLSEDNNTPEIALTRCACELENCGLDPYGVEIYAAPRHGISEALEV